MTVKEQHCFLISIASNYIRRPHSKTTRFFLIVPMLLIRLLSGYSGRILACCLFMLSGGSAFSQACDCPTSTTCGTCVGGLSSITLRYNGSTTVTVNISDILGDVFTASVVPGDLITFQGSLPPQKFVGDAITIQVNGVLNALITTSCATQLFVGDVFGDFTLQAAISVQGTSICCSPSGVETTGPEISNCPADISVSSATLSCGAEVSWAIPVATDACGVESFTSTHSPGDSFPIGTTVVTYTAFDGAGNSSSCSFNVTVLDDSNPKIANCPADISVAANASCNAIVTWVAPQASDNCSVTLTSTHLPGSTFPLGTTQVRYRAVDASGNTSECTFNVVVTDASNPVFSNCPANITVTTAAACAANVSWVPPNASDNCSVSVSSTHLPGASFPVGTTVVKYTATDGTGNSATCTFNVTVKDNTPPQFTTVPGNINVTLASGCSTAVTWTPPAVSDNCSVTVTSTHPSGSQFSIGTTQVRYTATDASGNSSAVSFDVTVTGGSPIISNCPGNITVMAADNCKKAVSWAAPVVSASCGIVTLTADHQPGDEFPLGTTPVTYTATDQYGNSTTCTFSVKVIDDSAPVISSCPPSPITFIANDNGVATVSWEIPLASDCSPVAVSANHDPGELFSIGETEVIYMFTDANAKQSACTFTVSVEDKSPPVFENCVTDITVTLDNACASVVTWSSPAVRDNSSIASVTSNYQSGDLFSIGKYDVQIAATDAYGNVGYCTFTVNIVSTVTPGFKECPGNTEVYADANGQAIISWVEPALDDPCNAYIVTRSHAPGTVFSFGSTTVTYSAATPGNTNAVTCSFLVTVVEAPIKFDLPKFFTPDGDGINDKWILRDIEKFEHNHIMIVDRWGGVVFESTNYDNERIVWDGSNGGKIVPTGTYFYNITVRHMSRQVETKGFIEVVR